MKLINLDNPVRISRLAGLGVPRERIHQELFYVENVAPEPARHSDAVPTGPRAETTVILDGRATPVKPAHRQHHL